jgi:PAS domain S-box-containing protein
MDVQKFDPSQTIKILLLEDDSGDADLCVRKLKRSDLNVEIDVARSSPEFMERARAQPYDLILTDYRLPDWTGLDALHAVRSLGRDTPVVLLTGTLGDELAIQCIKAGISDYVLKENLERLPVAVRRAVEEHKVRQSRDRAQRDLTESEKQYRLLFNANPHPMWVFDRETLHFLTVNDAAIDHYGYSLSEFLSMNSRDIRPPEEVERYLAAMRGGQNRGAVREVWKHKKKDGTIIDVEISAQPITFRAVEAVLVLAHDVTAQRRAEERYRSIIEGAPYGIFRVDQNGRIVMANRAFVLMLGYQTLEEVLGLNVGSDVYEDPAEQERVIAEFSPEASSLGHETKWIRKDRKAIIVRLAGRRLDSDDGLPGGHEVFVEDITATKSLQKQFEHAQKMEAVGRLAGGVAHDFNNLLMVISGYAQLLGESSADATKVSQYANQVRAASSKAAAITRQLLAFSRRQVVDPTVLDLNFIVQDLGKMLPRLLGEDIDLSLALSPKLGTVRADRTQIEQVIMNLAINARDAMPTGGCLIIETRNVELDAGYDQGREASVPPGRYVLLTVSDTGIGMSPEIQQHIFEPFFTTKEAAKGTGLGLATVYGIVKQSHGFIWVYSEPGKGTSFKVYLPRLDAIAALEETSQSATAPGGTETILLTEDDPALRDVSRVYLESKGYTVLQAANANEALQACKTYKLPIHLLITDVVMPGLGGVELARAALEIRPTLAIVLVSGYTDRMLDIQSIGIEVHFLQKPFNLEALARMARSLLDRPQEKPH